MHCVQSTSSQQALMCRFIQDAHCYPEITVSCIKTMKVGYAFLKKANVSRAAGRDKRLTAVEEESEGMWGSRAQRALFEGAGSHAAERRLWAAGNLLLESDDAVYKESSITQ